MVLERGGTISVMIVGIKYLITLACIYSCKYSCYAGSEVKNVRAVLSSRAVHDSIKGLKGKFKIESLSPLRNVYVGFQTVPWWCLGYRAWEGETWSEVSTGYMYVDSSLYK